MLVLVGLCSTKGARKAITAMKRHGCLMAAPAPLVCLSRSFLRSLR